jgi:FkbH-like protein
LRSLERDRNLPIGVRLSKGVRFAASLASAPLLLRQCTRVGARARTIGRPRIENAGAIEIGDELLIYSTFSPVELVTQPGARLEIGSNVAINYGTSIVAHRSVRIGDGVSIGPYCIISDAELPGAVNSAQSVAPREVEIGDGAWLAGRVTVLPGARIGSGSAIAAGSIVSGDIPPGVLAGGIPARVLRRLDGEQGWAEPAARNGAAPEPTAGAPTPPAASVDVAAASAPEHRGVLISDFTIQDLARELVDVSDPPAMQAERLPYGQVIQALIQREPSALREEFAVVWTRPEAVISSFQRLLSYEAVEPGELLAEVDGFCDVLLRGCDQYRFAFVPTWTLPHWQRGLGMVDTRPGGTAMALVAMNGRLMERLSSAPNVHVLNAQRWIDAAPHGGFSAKLWYLGKVPFSPAVFREAARDIKAAVRALTGRARKLIVLDLDDTLWGGIVGEIGWEQIKLGGHDSIGEACLDFQKALKNLRRRGVLLAIVSKNEEGIALDAIRKHPEMALREEDFAGWRINWEDKARNIVELASELNLGLQSVVFIDDNPVERARVREALPEILVPDWPEDKLLFPSALLGLRCFDSVSLTREDQERADQYTVERKRTQLKQAVGSMDEWLKSLGIRVRADPLDNSNLPRVAQLLNKTNQMNLSTRRLTELELTEWVKEPGRELWAIGVSDRLGEAGLTGIVGIEAQGEVARLVDFVLSCRVMGRKVEEAMVHLAVRRAQELGGHRLEATYLPTAKNKPCLDFWLRSGFAHAEARFVWDLTQPFALPEAIELQVREGHGRS